MNKKKKNHKQGKKEGLKGEPNGRVLRFDIKVPDCTTPYSNPKYLTVQTASLPSFNSSLFSFPFRLYSQTPPYYISLSPSLSLSLDRFRFPITFPQVNFPSLSRFLIDLFRFRSDLSHFDFPIFLNLAMYDLISVIIIVLFFIIVLDLKCCSLLCKMQRKR